MDVSGMAIAPRENTAVPWSWILDAEKKGFVEFLTQRCTGLTLQDALEAYSDPVLFRSYKVASDRAGGLRRVRFLMIPEPDVLATTQANNELVSHKETLWRSVWLEFKEKFQNVELLAVAERVPVEPGVAMPFLILPERFSKLVPNFRTNDLIGRGA